MTAQQETQQSTNPTVQVSAATEVLNRLTASVQAEADLMPDPTVRLLTDALLEWAIVQVGDPFYRDRPALAAYLAECLNHGCVVEVTR